MKQYRGGNFLKVLWNLSLTVRLIAFTIAVSVVSFILFSLNDNYLNYLALKPSNIIQGKYLWTIVTHMFIHGGLGHLLINMLVLFSLGSLCERIIGRKRFFWFYIISGLFAGLLSVILSAKFGTGEIGSRVFGSPEVYMVGASGAIFAIAGLYVMLLPRLKFVIIFLPFFSLPAYIMIPAALGVFWIVSIFANLPVGNVAHFGGLISGLAYGLFLKYKYKRKIEKLRRIFR